MIRREGDFHFVPCARLVLLLWGHQREKSGADTSAKPELRLREKIDAGSSGKPSLRLSFQKQHRRLGRRLHGVAQETMAWDGLIHYLMAWRERREFRPEVPLRASNAFATSAREVSAFQSAADDRPPRRILRRLFPSETKPKDALHHPAGRVEEPMPLRAQPANHRGPLEGEFNLNQLTDQVIQAIDRRIIAQRERLGRV
jgi:hypothetical protein